MQSNRIIGSWLIDVYHMIGNDILWTRHKWGWNNFIFDFIEDPSMLQRSQLGIGKRLKAMLKWKGEAHTFVNLPLA